MDGKLLRSLRAPLFIFKNGVKYMVDSILITASVITALTVITAFLFKIYNFFRKLEKKYDAMNELLTENSIHLLKLAVLNESLPLTDRIHAGEQYIKLGGNGFIKKKYEHLLEEYDKRYGGEDYER